MAALTVVCLAAGFCLEQLILGLRQIKHALDCITERLCSALLKQECCCVVV